MMHTYLFVITFRFNISIFAPYDLLFFFPSLIIFFFTIFSLSEITASFASLVCDAQSSFCLVFLSYFIHILFFSHSRIFSFTAQFSFFFFFYPLSSAIPFFSLLNITNFPLRNQSSPYSCVLNVFPLSSFRHDFVSTCSIFFLWFSFTLHSFS